MFVEVIVQKIQMQMVYVILLIIVLESMILVEYVMDQDLFIHVVVQVFQ